MVYYLGLH